MSEINIGKESRELLQKLGLERNVTKVVTTNVFMLL